MAAQRIPGVAVAVVRNGEVIKAQGYGLANVEHDVPVTAETIFQSGSLGKQFTATGVMLLVEDGKLALVGSAVEVLSGWPGIVAIDHHSPSADAYVGPARLHRRQGRFPSRLHGRRARTARVRDAAGFRARRSMEVQQHGIRPARRARSQGLGQLLRRPAARSGVSPDGHDDGAGDQRGGHRAAPGRRLPPGQRRAAEPGMGGAAVEHHGGRLAVSVAAGSGSRGIAGCAPERF